MIGFCSEYLFTCLLVVSLPHPPLRWKRHESRELLYHAHLHVTRVQNSAWHVSGCSVNNCRTNEQMGDQTVEIKQKQNLTQSQPPGIQTWRPKGDKLAFIMQWAKRFRKCQDQRWGPLEEAPAQSV